MPRISVSTPSPSEIAVRGREYSLLVQAQGKGGEIDAEKLSVLISQAGAEGAKAPAGDANLSFDEWSALFARPKTEAEGSGNAIGVFAKDNKNKLTPRAFDRRPVGPKDVRIQIAYASICHSDIHTVKGAWGEAKYPLAAGHEMVGVITEVGSEVKNFKVGDKGGIGCMVNSKCDLTKCEQCAQAKEEQYCPQTIFTYNSVDTDGTVTQGGYSTHIIANSHFVLKWPDNLSMEHGVPLLCAGITVYSPLKHYGMDKPGFKLGVVGLGGLGHCAVLLAKAMGVEVTVLSTSNKKKEEALSKLGADHFLVHTDKEAMKAAMNTLDGIIDTVSQSHDLSTIMSTLKVNGKLALVGVGAADDPMHLPGLVVFKRLTIGGSLIGGIAETQEMLQFAADKGVQCITESIPASYINEAYDRMNKSDVKYRFVINIQGTLVA